MEFIPLHFADRLTVINPQGTIGVVTLWSKPDYVIERFRQAGVDLNPATSPIAVFGTLYGNGLQGDAAEFVVQSADSDAAYLWA